MCFLNVLLLLKEAQEVNGKQKLHKHRLFVFFLHHKMTLCFGSRTLAVDNIMNIGYFFNWIKYYSNNIVYIQNASTKAKENFLKIAFWNLFSFICVYKKATKAASIFSTTKLNIHSIICNVLIQIIQIMLSSSSYSFCQLPDYVGLMNLHKNSSRNTSKNDDMFFATTFTKQQQPNNQTNKHKI